MRTPAQKTTGAAVASIGWLMKLRMLNAQSPSHVDATNRREIFGQSPDMRRVATVAWTAAAALGALLLAI